MGQGTPMLFSRRLKLGTGPTVVCTDRIARLIRESGTDCCPSDSLSYVLDLPLSNGPISAVNSQVHCVRSLMVGLTAHTLFFHARFPTGEWHVRPGLPDTLSPENSIIDEPVSTCLRSPVPYQNRLSDPPPGDQLGKWGSSTDHSCDGSELGTMGSLQPQVLS